MTKTVFFKTLRNYILMTNCFFIIHEIICQYCFHLWAGIKDHRQEYLLILSFLNIARPVTT